MALLKFCKSLNKQENQRLVYALDRNGLSYSSCHFQEMIVEAEKNFYFEISNRVNVKSIDHKNIVLKLMNISSIKELFHKNVDNCDCKAFYVIYSSLFL